ncbi:MAG: hypothetical protein KKA36_02940, partial [Gammaproteobacteria bacterium]|nr:hypothetical protein [Gammaproteobacteria bacterium]
SEFQSHEISHFSQAVGPNTRTEIESRLPQNTGYAPYSAESDQAQVPFMGLRIYSSTLYNQAQELD